MSTTSLDTQTALVVIDLQKGILSTPTVHPVRAVVERSAALAGAFRALGLPVVLVNVVGAAPGRTEVARPGGERPDDWADLAPELDQQPDDLTVSKQTWGAFQGTGLAEQLASRDVTQVVVTGVSTSIGVESTARQAYEHGFNVTLAVDAMTDRDADAHANSVERIFPRLGETGTTEDVIAMLVAAHE